MSNSVFKEYPSAHTDAGDSKVDSNLMVFINKNGSVSVDQVALQNLLINDAVDTKTSVSVLRISSPTPSLELEINQEKAEREKELQENSDKEELDDDGKNDASETKEDVPHISVTVENFLVPEEAKQLASDILSIAGITNPLQISVDYEFQRYVIANDHCYTPFTSPSQRKVGIPSVQPAATVKSSPSKDTPLKSKAKTIQTKLSKQESQSAETKSKIATEGSDAEEADSEDENEASDSEESYFSPSESESENDRDSDLDFNLNDRPSRVRKITRAKRIKQTTKTSRIARKRQSATDATLDTADDSTSSFTKRKVTKLQKKSSNRAVAQAQTSVSNKLTKSATSTPKSSLIKAKTESLSTDVVALKEDTAQEGKSSTTPLTGPPVPALAPISSDSTKPQQPKKDKKPPAHVEALFSDMSSLFSTPDIIKKVGGTEGKVTLSQPSIPIADNSTSGENKGFFIPITPSNSKTRQPNLTSPITVRTHQSTTAQTLASEQDKQLDLIDSIVQKELKETTSPLAVPIGEDIPNIVKMLENPESMISNVININPSPAITTTTAAHTMPTFTGQITNESTLLDDTDLLDGLGNAEDGLTEDLLQHVAKLVEDKNLQEVIDKQVLGVSTTTKPTTSVATFSNVPTKLVSASACEIIDEKPMDGSENVSISLQTDGSATQSQSPQTPQISRGKEPIKIVRSDGRVITLPPIEAPTTRGAKRRAQNQGTPDLSKVRPNDNQTPRNSQTPKSGVVKGKEIEERRQSLSQKKSGDLDKTTTPKKSTISTSAKDSNDDDDDIDDDSDGSYNSEDDPYRLWCICRQPHNNRFMICCDKCEDWFHGKCVNVTKAMGMEMEERGVEWVCPNCVKKQQGVKKQSDPKQLAPLSGSASSVTIVKPESPFLSCIVCKKATRPNSIYCSDDCIRRHAQTTIPIISSHAEADKSKKQFSSDSQKSSVESAKTLSTPLQKTDFLRNKNRVIVIEKKTGRFLTGNSAPTVENLKQWLHDHPTFETVHQGSPQALILKAKQMQLKQLAKDFQSDKQSQLFSVGDQKTQSTLKLNAQRKIVVVNPQKQTIGQQQSAKQVLPKLQKIAQQQTQQKPMSPIKSPQTPKTPTAPKVSTPIQHQKSANKRKQTSEPSSNANKNEPEPIRINVQRTLKEQLIIRSSEITDKNFVKLTNDEIAQFALETEQEIFHLFNKDTGSKYRAKYRSLMFNIKDRKNQTLFQKISSKAIDAKQLVRMSPEELASQELAMWRENENKHQLEMIKKSELDLLACAKSYVLKTHKGEEVIESKVSERVTLDPSVSVEDVVSVLNNSTVSSTSENILDTSPVMKDSRIDSRFEKYLSVDSSSNSTKLNSTSINNSKKNRRSRSRSRERHDSKKSSSKHKRKRSRDRRSRSRDRDKSRQDKNRERERERSTGDNEKKKDDKKDKERLKTMSTTKKSAPESTDTKVKEPPKPLKKEDNYSLIDKILEAQSTIDRILRPEESKISEEQNKLSKSTTIVSTEPVTKMASSESDQEPSSTVTIPTPPERPLEKDDDATTTQDTELIWTGSIIMVDLATFQIGIRSASGDCMGIEKELPTELDVVGRINPETVWDYIGKIKKSINKEILILRFAEASLDEKEAYYTLYKYLYTRKRLGVIKTGSSCIKDFYVAPLARHKSLPSVLMPLNGPGFEDDRPDILIGIIVKITSPPPRRPPSIPVKVVRVTTTAQTALKMKQKVTIVKDDQFTPPGSPQLDKLKLTHKVALPVFPKVKEAPPPPAEDDGDEPYSPGGSDLDDDETSYVPPKLAAKSFVTPSKPIISTDLMSPSQMEQDEIQRKMDELNRQIEAQKMEIAGMLRPQQTTAGDEPYSPTSASSPPINEHSSAPSIPDALANISIPSNLKEILNSIKNVTAGDTAASASISAAICASATVQSSATIDTAKLATPLLSSLIKSQTMSIDADDDEEYTPISVAPASYDPSADYIPSKTIYKPEMSMNPNATMASVNNSKTSKLAQLTEEELLSMVPDDAKVELAVNAPPPAKKAKYTIEPPPPGLEDEYIP